MLEKYIKVSSKGQITLPKAIQDLLRSNVVRIVVEKGVIRIEPVRDVGGGLRSYARTYVPLEKARDKAWEDATRDKYARR